MYSPPSPSPWLTRTPVSTTRRRWRSARTRTATPTVCRAVDGPGHSLPSRRRRRFRRSDLPGGPGVRNDPLSEQADGVDVAPVHHRQELLETRSHQGGIVGDHLARGTGDHALRRDLTDEGGHVRSSWSATAARLSAMISGRVTFVFSTESNVAPTARTSPAVPRVALDRFAALDSALPSGCPPIEASASWLPVERDPLAASGDEDRVAAVGPAPVSAALRSR